MRLTQFSDFALRALIYLDVQKQPVSLQHIAAAYGISRNHLVKVIALLQREGFVSTKRGPGGGVTLARPAEEINLGDVVRTAEPDFTLVECFDPETNRCPITPACKLIRVLDAAKEAFLAEISRYTLADVTVNRGQLGRLLAANMPSSLDEAGAESSPAPGA